MIRKTLFLGQLLLVAFSTQLSPAQANFFPLQVGNQWIYKTTGAVAGEPVTTEVVQSAEIDGREYFLVTGLGEGPVWLRLSEDGTLFSYSRETRQETVWIKFLAAEGEIHETTIHPCNPMAQLGPRGLVETPVGTFDDVLAVTYPGSVCADAGLLSDMFAPGVGLVERTMTTFAGPRIQSLIYARLGGTTVLSQPEVAFSLSLDRTLYTTRLITPVMTARITIRVTQSEPLELTFPNGQRFDIEFKNERGETVYRWSEGKFFPLIFGTECIGPGEKNWVVEIPLIDPDGNLFDPGRYTARSWLTTINEGEYSASVAFEISAARQLSSGVKPMGP